MRHVPASRRFVFFMTLASLAVSALAAEETAGRKSAHLLITATVVHSTSSPLAAVAQVHCLDSTDGLRCRTRQEKQAEEPAASCTATEDGTYCWY